MSVVTSAFVCISVLSVLNLNLLLFNSARNHCCCCPTVKSKGNCNFFCVFTNHVQYRPTQALYVNVSLFNSCAFLRSLNLSAKLSSKLWHRSYGRRTFHLLQLTFYFNSSLSTNEDLEENFTARCFLISKIAQWPQYRTLNYIH